MDRPLPSALAEADIREFQALMKKETGLQLDLGAAWKRAAQLIALVRSLIGPIPEDPEADSLRNFAVRRHNPLAGPPVDE